MSKKRITVTIDTDIDSKVRSLQARLIFTTQHGWSYSSVLEALVKNSIDTITIKNLISKNSD